MNELPQCSYHDEDRDDGQWLNRETSEQYALAFEELATYSGPRVVKKTSGYVVSVLLNDWTLDVDTLNTLSQRNVEVYLRGPDKDPRSGVERPKIIIYPR